MTFPLTLEVLDRNHIRGTFILPGLSLEYETYQTYLDIFELLAAEGLYLVKCHNFIPRITDGSRYHQFNEGRARAFGRTQRHTRPASCGLGAPAGHGFEIRFLASTNPAYALDNPHQTPPEQYPPQHGPPPTFSRAVVVGEALYISGTASIVGHTTTHKGDLLGQFAQTWQHITTLLGKRDPARMRYTVYVPKTSFQELLQPRLPAPARFVTCDLCRDDLLVEIEATTLHAHDTDAVYP